MLAYHCTIAKGRHYSTEYEWITNYDTKNASVPSNTMRYSLNNRCTTCNSLLNPLSRNKGTRTLSNRNRLQQTVRINSLHAAFNGMLTLAFTVL